MPSVYPTTSVLTDARRISANYYAHLRPLIIGPLADLHRYSVDDEKASISLGAYNASSNTAYGWPGKATESEVDLDYTKVWMDDVLLKYLSDMAGSGSGVAPVAGYPYRVRAAGHIFQSTTNEAGTVFSRSAALYDRDVQVGDTVKLRGVVSSVTYDHTTTVAGFVPETVAAVIGAASSEGDNDDTQVASTSIDQVENDLTNEVTATADGTDYDGLADGNITETYTITVIQSSTNGDATTALLRVRSASGNDDQDSVVPAAFGSPTAIGARGLEVTWDLDGGPSMSAEAIDEGIDPNDLVVGQEWVCEVAQAFTAPTSTSGGTYTGDKTLTYVVRVFRGGTYGDAEPPQITATTTTGEDMSGATNVTATNTFVTVGTLGVQIKFSQTKLSKDDVYYITATGPLDGAMRTLVLTNAMPVGMQSATDLDLHLYITKDSLQISENRVTAPPAVNWSVDDVGVTIESGITIYESSWTDNGVLMAIAVSEGEVFAEYREWLTADADRIYEISDINTVDSVIDGPLDPSNPVKYAVYKALQNTALTNLGGGATAGDVVKYTFLNDAPDADDEQPWRDVLSLITGLDGVYNLVPLTYNTTVFSLFKTHVDSQSAAEIGHRRAAIIPLQAATSAAIVDDVTSSDDAVVLAKITQNPALVTTAFTRVYVPAGNAQFVTNGVEEDDIVRAAYTTDGFGNETWTEFVVDEVTSEDTLLLKAGPATAVNTAQKLEVWRNYSKTEVTDNLLEAAQLYASSRVVCVWPDLIGQGGTQLDGYYLCASIAALIGSVPSHQGLTNVQILGYDDVSRSTEFFNTPNLDALSNGGVWVVTQLSNAGAVYTRRAVTSDASELNTFEEVIRRDADEFAFLLTDQWDVFRGSSNNTSSTMNAMSTAFTSLVGELKSQTFSPRLGSMIDGATLSGPRMHTFLRDHVVATVTMAGPNPINVIELTVVQSL